LIPSSAVKTPFPSQLGLVERLHRRPVQIVPIRDYPPEYRVSVPDTEMVDLLAENEPKHHGDYWTLTMVDVALKSTNIPRSIDPTIDLYSAVFAQKKEAQITKAREIADQFISARLVNDRRGSTNHNLRTNLLNEVAQLSGKLIRLHLKAHDCLVNNNRNKRIEEAPGTVLPQLDPQARAAESGYIYSQDLLELASAAGISESGPKKVANLEQAIGHLGSIPLLGSTLGSMASHTIQDSMAEKAVPIMIANSPHIKRLDALAETLGDKLHKIALTRAPNSTEGKTLEKNIGDKAYDSFLLVSKNVDLAAVSFVEQLAELPRDASNPTDAYQAVPFLCRNSGNTAFTKMYEIKLTLRMRAKACGLTPPDENTTQARLFAGGLLDDPVEVLSVLSKRQQAPSELR
jgi:hypothetical protein